VEELLQSKKGNQWDTKCSGTSGVRDLS